MVPVRIKTMLLQAQKHATTESVIYKENYTENLQTLKLSHHKNYCFRGVTNCCQISYTLPEILFEIAENLKSEIKEC